MKSEDRFEISNVKLGKKKQTNHMQQKKSVILFNIL